MLSPLLYSLFTQDCTARHDSNIIIKFADDTTVVGLITDNDETAYREVVRDLTVWCQDSNLSLNVIKTKEMIVDYRKKEDRACPHSHRQDCSGVGFRASTSTNMVQAHQDSCEEGTTKCFSPQETENICHGSSDPQKVL
jgi:hypothetical protein